MMLEALAVASGGILSVGAILIVLLLLASRNGLRKGVAFLVGYCGGYLAIGLGSVFLNQQASPGPSERTLLGSLVIGVLLIAFGLNTWRKPPNPNPRRPAFFDTLDEVSAAKVAAVTAVVPFVNMKNLAIYLAAVSLVMEGDLSTPMSVLGVLAVLAVFSSSVVAPVLAFALFRDRATPYLERFTAALETHSRVITIVVMLVFGAGFLARGIWGLR